jgi:hypothetical protein
MDMQPITWLTRRILQEKDPPPHHRQGVSVHHDN